MTCISKTQYRVKSLPCEHDKNNKHGFDMRLDTYNDAGEFAYHRNQISRLKGYPERDYEITKIVTQVELVFSSKESEN